MSTPLYTSISGLVLMLEKSPAPDALQLEFMKAHLAEAASASTNEIEELAVEGIQETYDDMMAQSDDVNRASLLELLKASLQAYLIQLLKEEQHL